MNIPSSVETVVQPDSLTDQTSPFVSVIIPVFNDRERLHRCLEALNQQTYPQSCYEVIVVDNGSKQEENPEQMMAQFSQARLTIEPTPGSYAARNTGIALAKGEILAFTDADCIPEADWIERGVHRLLEAPHCGLVAGRIEIFFQHPGQATPVELYEKVTAFPQEHLLKQHRYAAAGNLFTFKTVIDRVGAFDLTLKSNGDVEWCQRVFAQGYPQLYADDVCVHHPARYSVEQLYKRTIRLAGGVYDLQRKRNPTLIKRNLMFLRGLIFDLVPPLMFVFNAFRDPRLQGFDQKAKASLMMFFVRYLTAWEKVRLKLGAVSARE